jgi:chromosome segregation ATPase
MPMFGKGKVPDEIKPGEQSEDDAPEAAKPAAATKDREMALLAADVEKLKARVQALDETRKLTNDRFSAMDEKIGELRAGLIEREKEIETIGVKATKAHDMMSLVHPETIAADMGKRDAKIQGLEAKLDASRELMGSIVEDMKGFRNQLRAFSGLEQVGKMNIEMRQELSTLKSVQARIDVNASKVEKMFVDIEERYSEFAKARDVIASLSKGFNDIAKEFNSLKVKSADFVGRAELRKLEATIEGQVDWIKKLTKDPKPFQDFFQKFKYMEAEYARTKKTVEEMRNGFAGMSEEFAKLSEFIVQKVRELEERAGEAEKLRDSIEDTLQAFDKKIEGVVDVIDTYADKVDALSRGQAAPRPRSRRQGSGGMVEGGIDFDGLRDFAMQCLSMGYSLDRVRKALFDAGYTEEEVRTVMESL